MGFRAIPPHPRKAIFFPPYSTDRRKKGACGTTDEAVVVSLTVLLCLTPVSCTSPYRGGDGGGVFGKFWEGVYFKTPPPPPCPRGGGSI